MRGQSEAEGAAPQADRWGSVRIAAAMSAAYGLLGVSLPFLPRWLEAERGLSGAEIGLVLSAAPLARVLTGPVIAAWADGAADRRAPLRALAAAGLLAYAAFFLADGLTALVVFGFLAATFTGASGPLLEAAALRARFGDFGRIRGAGSTAFILANIVGGVLIAHYGLGAVAVWILGASALFLAATLTVLKPDPGPRAEGGFRTRLLGAGRLLAQPRYRAAILAGGLIQASHAFYYGFSVNLWRAQGIDAGTCGLLWGFAVAVEVVFLFSLARIEARLPAAALIALGGAGAVLRWAAMAAAPPLALLWPLQALHALSFAASHVGVLRIIQAETPEGRTAVGQTLYAGLASGLFLGLGSIGSGVLYDTVGAAGYWMMAGLGVAGLIVMARGLRGSRAATGPTR